MCVNITNVLHENGYEVTLCATREGGPLQKFVTPGVRCHILRKKHAADITAFMRLIRLIRDNDIEIIHAHSSSVFWAVATKLFVKNIKVIWHDHLGIRIIDRQKDFFYKFISQKIDGIVAVNRELAGWSRANMKVPIERVVLINNFSLMRETPKNLEHVNFTIVCLANIRPQKDHETLIRAIVILKKEQLLKKLKVIFAGAYNEDLYFNRIKNLIRELDLNNIIELPGSVEDTATLLSCADCGVLSSISEGLPVSLLEYGMAGLPVVVTDVGHCAEAVGYGKFGWLVPSGDPELLAKELLWIIHNPVEASQKGSAFRVHVEKEYGPGQFLIKYQSLLNEICRE